MGMNVEHLALMLEVIAGKDDLDPRQYDVRTKPYTEALHGDVKGMKFGIVKEGFAWEGASEKEVDESVMGAAHLFEKAGGAVTEVSIPMHREGIHIWNAVATEGALAQMVLHEGMGLNWQGYYSTAIVDFYGRSRRALADNFSDTVKFVILLGQYMANKYFGRYYAKAQNLVPMLRKEYDKVLKDVDVLIMPTTPRTAMPIPYDPTTADYFTTALGMIQNTCPFNLTHHPAISVPCAMSKSKAMPVGMMLIGRHFVDDQVLRAGDAFQKLGVYAVNKRS
jgi:amidase